MKAAALAAALLLAAGCGGDDDETKAEQYVADGNVACRETVDATAELEQPSGDSADAVAAYADAFLPIARRRYEALRALEPPDELERFHDRLLEEQRRFVAAVETLGEAAGRDDRATAERAAQEGARASRRSTILFRQLGLTVCANSAP